MVYRLSLLSADTSSKGGFMAVAISKTAQAALERARANVAKVSAVSSKYATRNVAPSAVNYATKVVTPKAVTKTTVASPVTIPAINDTADVANPIITPATPKTSGYVVGSGFTPSTVDYANSTDPNAAALKAYDNQLNAYKAALQAAYDSQAAANAEAQKRVKSQYDAARSDAYSNARLSAIGNNERLAALGLAGNLYDYARSGTSETSRIAQDVSMRKSLSALDQGQAAAHNEYELALLQAQKEADINYANKVAEVEAAKIPYQVALAQALATVSDGGGGGGGGGSSRTYTKSSSKKSSSGGGSGGTTGTVTGDQLFNSINAAAKYDSRTALKKAVDKEVQSAAKSVGADQNAINTAIQKAIDQYSANAAANLKKSNDSSKTSTYKYSSRYVG